MNIMENEIQKVVVIFVESAAQNLTPHDLKQMIINRYGCSRRDAGTIVGNLVREGRLEYIQEFGRTFIDVSLRRPVRLSNRIVVKPPGIDYAPEPNDIVLKMETGASFGSGKHPTTRMALLGMERAIGSQNSPGHSGRLRMLDIGTGSGILALAALAMGIDLAVGTDTDSICRYEARQNAVLNGFEDRFEVRDGSDIPTEYGFDLVTANLRYPTLKQIGPKFSMIMKPGSAAVLSGIKESEVAGLIEFYKQLYFDPVDVMGQKGWAGVVLKLKSESKSSDL